MTKTYTLPNGKKAVFEYDINGVGKITLECMDELMALLKATAEQTEPQTAECPFDDTIPCEWVCTEYGKCKYKPKTEPQTEVRYSDSTDYQGAVDYVTDTDCSWK